MIPIYLAIFLSISLRFRSRRIRTRNFRHKAQRHPNRRRAHARFFSRSPLTLSSNEGGATTDTPHQEKQLLHFVNGTVPEGALCALMGPSGSGKSTLLDLLSGRKNYGRCEGRVLFKGSSIADQQVGGASKIDYLARFVQCARHKRETESRPQS